MSDRVIAALEAPAGSPDWQAVLQSADADAMTWALEEHNRRMAPYQRARLRVLMRRVAGRLGRDDVIRIADLMRGLDDLRHRQRCAEYGRTDPFLPWI